MPLELFKQPLRILIFIALVYNCARPVDYDDGLPICFSYPVLPSSISAQNFLCKRSDGEQFSPKCISTFPNWEYNERHCVVVFDDFFNRKLPGEEGRLYMEEMEIVGPLMLVGPSGLINAQGMTFRPDPNATSYETGPIFIGARLVPLHNYGEGGPPTLEIIGQNFLPNSGIDLYGDGNTQDNLYRLRLYYSGGMTPDGLLSLRPTLYDNYFTLVFSTGQEISTANETMIIDNTNTSVTVLGLAETGRNQEAGYDNCYQEDRDNYIDIILQVTGDPSNLTTLESLRAFDNQPGLYNPGGPGPTPFENITYTAPAPLQIIQIDVDLDRIREVTYCVHQNGMVSTDISTCTSWAEANELRTIPLGSAAGSGSAVTAGILPYVVAVHALLYIASLTL